MTLTPSARGSRPGRARVMLTAALLTSGLSATLAVTAVIPAGAHTAATVQHKKPRPSATTSATPGASPTGTTTATATSTAQSPPTSSTPATTAAPSATPEPSITPEPSATPTVTPAAQPGAFCATEAAVVFEGSLYCPGQIVGVQTGAYGVPSRVVLQGVTVVEVSGPTVSIMGGPDCLPDPEVQEPQYCGASVATMEVDFTGSASMPASGTGIDLYGLTNATAEFDPDGFITVAWCDPDTCP